MSRSDWSADVWSSDLAEPEGELDEVVIAELLEGLMATDAAEEDELVLGIIDDVGIVRHVDRFEDEAGFLVAVEAHEAFPAGRSELLGDACQSPFGEGPIDAALLRDNEFTGS